MGGTVQRIVNLGGGRGFLRENAAKSLHRIDKRIGHRAQTTETLRSWAQQNEHYQRYLRYGYPIALSPDGPPRGNGPSIHQRGEAVDSDELQNHVALAADHGFIRTVYRWVNGVWTLVERWHFEYFAERDNHRSEVVTLVRTASGAWHLPDPLSGGNTTPETEPEEDESEEDTMKVFGYKKPGESRTMYVTMDFAGGLWDEFVTSDADYARSVAEKWGNGAPLLSLTHRDSLKAKFDRRWPELAD